MRILFAIFVLCLSALLWATVAITRHILRHKNNRKEVQDQVVLAQPPADAALSQDIAASQPVQPTDDEPIGAGHTVRQD